MSGLAGVIGWPGSEAALLTARMLGLVEPCAAAALQCGHLAGAVISADAASEHGVSVVASGKIFNAPFTAGRMGCAAHILGLYRELGLDGALQEMNGDFAVAVVDEREGSVHLARDRFGVRPLYYWVSGGKFAFASRLRSLLCLADIPRDPDRAFVGLFAGSHYRYFDNAPERSPFTAISQLPAAHCLTWREAKIRVHRYWTLDAEHDLESGEHALASQYRALLVDAVRVRLAHVSRPAFTLSGGMDSSSVLACAVHSSGRRQHAFSTVYEDKTFDESEDIKPILDATVERWHPVKIDAPDVCGLVREMVEFHDEPVATATWLPHYLMCREAARQGFDSLFGGLGGDELNAGEYEHFLYFFADLHSRGMRSRVADETRMWVRYHDHPIYRKSPAGMEAELARLVDFSVPGRCLPDRRRIDRYAAAVDPGFFDVRRFEPVMEHPSSSYLKNRTWQDLSRETVPCCLRAEDRQSAAFGLVNVDPFFDHRLVEFMFRVPSTLKYCQGVTKQLLRVAMKGVLPEPTRTRVKKTGWNAPAHQWFSGAGRSQLEELIHSRRLRNRRIYRLEEVERLLAEHDDIVSHGLPQDNHMMFLWQLVNLDAWLDWVDTLPAGT